MGNKKNRNRGGQVTSSNPQGQAAQPESTIPVDEGFVELCLQSTTDLNKIAYGREAYTVVVPLERCRDVLVTGRIVVAVVKVDGVPGVTVIGSDFEPIQPQPAQLAIWTLYQSKFPVEHVTKEWQVYLRELWLALRWACKDTLDQAAGKHRDLPDRLRGGQAVVRSPYRRQPARHRNQDGTLVTLH